MLEVFINVILLRKPVIKKRIEYHDALNGKLKKTKKNIRIKRYKENPCVPVQLKH